MPFWFFLSPEDFQNKKVTLKAELVQHLKAARLKTGDNFVLSDGLGRAFYARLDYINSKNAVASLLDEVQEKVEPSLHVTLFAGVSKGEKMDRIIRQSVELGVKKIVPVLTERTVVRLTSEKGGEKAGRWQKIAVSAASQCRRSFIPLVHSPLSFDDMAQALKKEKIAIVPWEEEKEKGLLRLTRQIEKKPGSICIFTGPEGGISPEEMAALNSIEGVYPVSLGPRILRAETAPLAILSIVMYLWGDLGRKIE
ncbi:MAG: 16S rRNA (uracil(1498)-N(3))-methyltransferase [Bacillota bacterium]|nr:16S rRNA (uracil(1498)-N(3))-methyltransferase [Bacillota bacterium]